MDLTETILDNLKQEAQLALMARYAPSIYVDAATVLELVMEARRADHYQDEIERLKEELDDVRFQARLAEEELEAIEALALKETA
jgi:predicted nucleic acid-binding protein